MNLLVISSSPRKNKSQTFFLLCDCIIEFCKHCERCHTSMKALFDRSCHFIHCKRLTGKYIAGIVSSGSGKDNPVINYMKHYALTCGAQFAGGISSKVLIDKITEGKSKDFWKGEYDYWKEKGWL